MKILVIEDKKENIEAAKILLKDHELTIATSFDEAIDVLTGDFDVVLTDVMIPKGSDRCVEGLVQGGYLDTEKPAPYGPFIALRALQAGIKKVGILTMGNHHYDPFMYALDDLPGFNAGDIKVAISNRGMEIWAKDIGIQPNESYKKMDVYKASDGELESMKNYVKDWAKLLEQLL